MIRSMTRSMPLQILLIVGLGVTACRRSDQSWELAERFVVRSSMDASLEKLSVRYTQQHGQGHLITEVFAEDGKVATLLPTPPNWSFPGYLTDTPVDWSLSMVTFVMTADGDLHVNGRSLDEEGLSNHLAKQKEFGPVSITMIAVQPGVELRAIKSLLKQVAPVTWGLGVTLRTEE
jgi:hypothetical protein